MLQQKMTSTEANFQHLAHHFKL